MSDEWAIHMESVADYLSDNFKERSMGLVCDFAQEVNKVYTAVFPSKLVMQKILDDGAEDSVLFVHHPSIWDIRKAPNVFYQMDRDLLERFKDNRISIFNLHVPLDAFGQYSTSVTLANAIGLEIVEPFAPYHGVLCGVICKSNFKSIDELESAYSNAVGHSVNLYQNGDSNIEGLKIAVVAGGGLDEEIDSAVELGAKVFVTGITANNDHHMRAHGVAKDGHVHVLGGTHYSTEKFACMAMVEYFKKLGLDSEFIKDNPVMEDM
ncbi:hypothetical protein HN358_03790 [Candidatus Uhrbacteria bacterium]|nr:hypothetical protein [Candidatus Uhrbacteria bacterium]MBT7717659.1 hypothetical protein [Candidatus Uhrbacteria bacterium]